MYKFLLLIGLTLSVSGNSLMAATIEVEMLNRLGKESMVYSQSVVQSGDTVKWLASSKGHNVQFLTTPNGVDAFKSKLSVDVEYTFNVPGIYLYQCTPHKSMGMIAVVVVDENKDNIDSIMTSRVGGKSKKRLASILTALNS
jgi:pseudoazurin